jgi:hypothetical protein
MPQRRSKGDLWWSSELTGYFGRDFPAGLILANAATVPAGANGPVTVVPGNPTDYFASEAPTSRLQPFC